jgi:hypothetical protein
MEFYDTLASDVDSYGFLSAEDSSEDEEER